MIHPIVLFGDAHTLSDLLAARGVVPVEVAAAGPLAVPATAVGVAHSAEWTDAMVSARAPTAEGGAAQVAALDHAIDAVLGGRARALVTGPTSKAAIVASGVPFTGQTERLARAAGLPDDAVTMMFLGPRLRVALVTTHLAVRDAPDAITDDRVHRSIAHLVDALDALGYTGAIEVTGLNPHAGESGLFGGEETRSIGPAIERAQTLASVAASRLRVIGPVPAETAFRRAAADQCVGVVTMIHDQATIASKLLDFGSAVNVTWGLPFVRTSVDHGVAYDAAAAGVADPQGMRAAIELAVRLMG
jgi:4-hydroxythreonine-4-phosphate dehydrogenase